MSGEPKPPTDDQTDKPLTDEQLEQVSGGETPAAIPISKKGQVDDWEIGSGR
jgi:bacteriocin-like protein